MTAIITPPLYVATEEQPIVKELTESTDVGFVSLFRTIRSHWIWQDAEKLKWWMDILLEVNYTAKKVLIGGRLLECGRGQSLNSLPTWAKRWRTDVSAVRRFFKLLESDDMIITENVSKTTRLTVCKYDSYQTKQHDCDTQTTRRRHADDILTTSNNKDNKENKVNKDNKERDKPSPIVFVKPNKEVLTNYFCEIGLDDFTAQGQAAKFLDYYEANGWKVGRNSMKDWQATARNWKSNMTKFSNNATHQHLTPRQKPAGAKQRGAHELLEDLRNDFGAAGGSDNSA